MDICFLCRRKITCWDDAQIDAKKSGLKCELRYAPPSVFPDCDLTQLLHFCNKDCVARYEHRAGCELTSMDDDLIHVVHVRMTWWTSLSFLPYLPHTPSPLFKTCQNIFSNQIKISKTIPTTLLPHDRISFLNDECLILSSRLSSHLCGWQR